MAAAERQKMDRFLPFALVLIERQPSGSCATMLNDRL